MEKSDREHVKSISLFSLSQSLPHISCSFGVSLTLIGVFRGASRGYSPKWEAAKFGSLYMKRKYKLFFVNPVASISKVF